MEFTHIDHVNIVFDTWFLVEDEDDEVITDCESFSSTEEYEAWKEEHKNLNIYIQSIEVVDWDHDRHWSDDGSGCQTFEEIELAIADAIRLVQYESEIEEELERQCVRESDNFDEIVSNMLSKDNTLVGFNSPISISIAKYLF